MAQQVSRINSDQFIAVINTSGNSISELRCVKANSHLLGFEGIALANSGDSVMGITVSSSVNQQKTYIAVSGAIISSVNTSAWTPGTELYCNSLGELTSNNNGYPVAKVIFKDSVNGKIKVLGDLMPAEYMIEMIEDSGDPDILYVGKAPIGSDTSDAVWQIKRIDENSGTEILWADANANFDNVWDNREALSYA
jgi:hypothetical protein